jgi:hypothetical protein
LEGELRLFVRMFLLVAAATILVGCGSRELLSKASMLPATISPNADGAADATSIHYELSSNALISIQFVSVDNRVYYFRRDQLRSAGQYDVLFGGVIDGQLLPDGDYTWTIQAGEASEQGKLTISDGEASAPKITKLTLSPKEFTPNQDGISDRVKINVVLNKSATLFVTVQNQLCNGASMPPSSNPTLDCTSFPLSETEGAARQPGEAGLHLFDYDAGVDLGADPPPDGQYVITARAEDTVGQTDSVSDTLTIRQGGVPRAEIVDGTVQYSARSLILGQTLYFTLTVENYSDVPIRTSGPLPGYVYTNTDQTYNWPGYAEESGVWRVGIGFETMKTNYPFRWAVGNASDLIVQEIDGQKYYYLPPNARAVITGGMTITELPQRNPVNFFAALIHEDVEIAPINQNVDPQPVLVLK